MPVPERIREGMGGSQGGADGYSGRREDKPDEKVGREDFMMKYILGFVVIPCLVCWLLTFMFIQDRLDWKNRRSILTGLVKSFAAALYLTFSILWFVAFENNFIELIPIILPGIVWLFNVLIRVAREKKGEVKNG